MFAYHEVSPETVPSILAKGLMKSPRGEKGQDASIAKTDKVLDECRPEYLRTAGVSRDNNNYGYVVAGGNIKDITDGRPIPTHDFIRQSDRAILKLTLTPERCYVSDLDMFDTVKDAIDKNESDDTIKRLALTYWDSLISLAEYKDGDINRPEIIIPYDLPPENIEVVKG